MSVVFFSANTDFRVKIDMTDNLHLLYIYGILRKNAFRLISMTYDHTFLIFKIVRAGVKCIASLFCYNHLAVCKTHAVVV